MKKQLKNLEQSVEEREKGWVLCCLGIIIKINFIGNIVSYKDLLEMCKRKIIQNESIAQILKKNEMFLNTLDEEDRDAFNEEIKKAIDTYNTGREKRKKYWMLLCNPRLWKEDKELYEVNDLLENFEPQRWKINSQTMDKKVKKHDLGIIKVGEDGRTDNERYNDEKKKTEPKLEAGIYAIFEVTGEETYFVGNECFVDIKFINNLFLNKTNISKEKSIELLDKRKKTYSSMSSIKIDEDIFDEVLNYIDDNQ